MCVSTVVTDLGELVAEKRRQFAARNLESARLHDEARLVLPGGGRGGWVRPSLWTLLLRG